MSDDDLIRRGDAIAAVRASDFRWGAEEAIDDLPAVTVEAILAKVPTRYQTANGDRLLHESDILAAMEPVTQPAPDAAAIRIADEVFDRLEAKGATAAAFGAAEVGEALREAGAQSDAAAIREAWERSYWRLRSYAVHDNDCKLNKPPRFDGPCSCGLTAALEEALALLTEKPHDRA